MTARSIDGQVSAIDIVGSLTRAAEQTVSDAYRAADGPTTRVIILNFEKMEYMNSSGIGLLVMILVRAKRRDQQVFAFGLTPHYQDIFELTRLNEAVHIHPDEASALQAAHQI
jgi:anti-sigma B factor antagonist